MIDLSKMSQEEKQTLLNLLQEKENLKKFNKLKFFEPYDYQMKYINASNNHTVRFMQAGNRVGKSEVAAYEITCHATGVYPKWWKGQKFTSAARILCAGVSNTTVRDIMQAKLVGEPTSREDWGSGMIPKELLGQTARKAGIPDALSSVLVKHVSGGWSKITFTSYESGKESFMGTSMHHVNLDEEPPLAIFSQAIRAITDTNGNISITATPENGMTELIRDFMDDSKAQGRYIQRVTWDDCPHLTPEVQSLMLAQLPEYERDMRSKGVPVLGSGLIYPIAEDTIRCEPFPVPEHWLRIAGIDFGYDHPAAWVSVAWDREEDIVYIVDCLKMEKMTPDQQSQKIKERNGRFIPIAWPADGMTSEKGTGISLKQQYEDLYFLPDSFLNPSDPITGQANRSVEAGIMEIHTRMKSGKLKIFQQLSDIFDELRIYHRKDGKIYKKFDDVMDAMRYGVMSIQNGETAKHSFKAYVPTEFQDDAVAY